MLNTVQFVGKDLEVLVRTALLHGELSPGIARAIASYQAKAQLTAAEKRQLEILERAIADGCIVPV
ncbi:hypothetical protein [Leptothoe sp. PORK10 BA2]|uniref:hypothetical protein n=1 Tax=Leptothoe sp. PORK10 BA2 TaxID=3110254 RepID=UPI002B205E06|nr:hypothetical protein [Leptothoe sp. PORK10 BA2]MEA5465123.1 hypothetical protein [Leptothoe sp. PORK10 BA2]